MEHDRLCRYNNNPAFDYLTYCEICTLIEAVRRDEHMIQIGD